MNGPIRYMSAADIAALFGTQPGTVKTWRQRYDDFPDPDAVIGISHGHPIAGWLPEREKELRDWHKARPGRGAGGGPKPKRRADDGS